MNMKNAAYHLVKIASILLTVYLIVVCLFFGLIYYCSRMDMDVPTIGPFMIYSINPDANSMLPKLVPGDLIIISKTSAAKLKPNDIITYTAFESETIITHRITSVTQGPTGYEFRTKGDFNTSEDSFVTPENRIIGKYVMVLPKLATFVEFTTTRPYIIVALVLLILLIQFLLGFAEKKLKPGGDDKPPNKAPIVADSQAKLEQQQTLTEQQQDIEQQQFKGAGQQVFEQQQTLAQLRAQEQQQVWEQQWALEQQQRALAQQQTIAQQQAWEQQQQALEQQRVWEQQQLQQAWAQQQAPAQQQVMEQQRAWEQQQQLQQALAQQQSLAQQQALAQQRAWEQQKQAQQALAQQQALEQQQAFAQQQALAQIEARHRAQQFMTDNTRQVQGFFKESGSNENWSASNEQNKN